MSERPLPAYADVRKVFQQEAEISGFVELERLPRLRESLVSDEARIRVCLRFHRDEAGRRLIDGELQGQVTVQCERCLGPVVIELQDDISLALVESEAQAKALPAELDPWLGEDDKLDLAMLVEEQALLSLPIVSYHPETECQRKPGYQTPPLTDGADGTDGDTDQNPFSILKSLKESDQSE